MTATTSLSVILGDRRITGNGTVVGALEILDADLHVVASGPLMDGDATVLIIHGPGHYMARGILASGGLMSEVVEVPPGAPTATVVLSAPWQEIRPPTETGWLAAWRPNVDGSTHEPVDRLLLDQVSGGLVVDAGARHGENVIVQYATTGTEALLTAIPAGMPVRVAVSPGTTDLRMEPASSLAAVLAGFLHSGDLASARALIETAIAAASDDPAVDLAVGYHLLRCADGRLDAWSRRLVERHPRSFDAHLIRGWAKLYAEDEWPSAGDSFRTATRCGLPTFSRGLRLLDDALRLVTAGDADPSLAAARRRYLLYLRAALDTSLTTFWGTQPDAPALRPTPGPPPPHARLAWFDAGRIQLAEGSPAANATARPRLPRILAEAAESLGTIIAIQPVALGGTRLIGDTAAVSHDPVAAGAPARFTIPPALARWFGSRAVGTVVTEPDAALVVITNAQQLSEPVRLVVTAGTLAQWFELQAGPHGALLVRLPVTGPAQPREIYLAVITTTAENLDAAEVAAQAAADQLERFRRTGLRKLLEEAIEGFRRAVDLARADDPARGGYLSNLGLALRTRFEQSGDADALDSAISAAQQAVEATSHHSDDLALHLSNLGAALTTRFRFAADPRDLDIAVVAGHAAVAGTHPAFPGLPDRLANLAGALITRFEWSGASPDLDEAITALYRAVALAPSEDPNRSGYLTNTSVALRIRFEHSGDPNDLEAAAETARAAVIAATPGNPHQAGILSNLGLALTARYARTGNINDLDEAITVFQTAVEATSTGQPDRGGRQANLAGALVTRFRTLGSVADLDAAIATGRAAVHATPPGHPTRAVELSNLGLALRHRFEFSGEPSDLNEAVDAARDAVYAVPADHSDRAGYLNNLGYALRIRSEQTGAPADIEAAIAAFREALDATPRDSPSRPGFLANLAAAWSIMFAVTSEPADLVAAIDAGREALANMAPSSVERVIVQSNLGLALRARYEMSGEIAELDAAIAVAAQAVDGAPNAHADKVTFLANLGDAHASRYKATGDQPDLDAALEAWRAAGTMTTAAPAQRLIALRRWALVAHGTGRLALAADGYAMAVALLPQIAWHGLGRATQQARLSQWAELAADAAGNAIERGASAEAVGLLEHGRSVLWNQNLHRNADLAELGMRAPELARRVDANRTLLVVASWESGGAIVGRAVQIGAPG